jgi:NADH-quinone oxidoreductase subunit L
VVGAPTAALAAGRAEESLATEWALVGVAVLVALGGIALAAARLRPAALRSKAESPPEPAGIERVLANKYYVDEIYDAAIVRPLLATSRNVLYTGLDVGIIDRTLVVGLGWQLPRVLARIGTSFQTGQLGAYAWVLLVGVVLVLGAFTLR